MTQITETFVRFRTQEFNSSITRPANITAYANGDAISDSDNSHFILGSSDGFGGGKRITQPGRDTGTLNHIILMTDANQATKLECDIFLFDEDLSDTADNGLFLPDDSAMDRLIGVVSVREANWIVANPGSGADGSAVAQIRGINMPFRTVFSLHAQMVARNAYTPVSGETFTLRAVVTKD